MIDNFYGFKTKILLGEMLGNFVGKISRVDFVNILDGRNLGGIPVSKIEYEMIQFFTYYFANKMTDKFTEMKNDILMEF